MDKERIFDEIVKALELQVRAEFGDDVSVKVNEVIKTNSNLLHGVNIINNETHVAPLFYLENYLSDYEAGTSAPIIAGKIIEDYKACMKTMPSYTNISASSLQYENVRSKLRLQLVSYELNAEMLKSVVHRKMDCGLVMLPIILFGEDENGIASAKITNKLAEEYGYDVDKIFDDAMYNTETNYPAELTDIGSIISGMLDNAVEVECSPGNSMFVLTNSTKLNGAIALFYPGMQKMIADKFDCNYYVLPSSIHEVIIMPEKHTPFDPDDLRNIVTGINMAIVDLRDILSNDVFKYDRQAGTLYVV